MLPRKARSAPMAETGSFLGSPLYFFSKEMSTFQRLLGLGMVMEVMSWLEGCGMRSFGAVSLKRRCYPFCFPFLPGGMEQVSR